MEQNRPAWVAFCMGGHLQSLQRRIMPQNVNTERWDHDAPLTTAARFGQAKAVEWLLQIGADAKHHGSAALRCAADKGHFNIMAMLLQHGADVNVVMLHSVHDVATVRLLVRAGISIDAPVYWSIQTTSLCYALRHYSEDVARALIDCGAKLDLVQSPIPDWVPAFVAARKSCRYAALLLMGIRKRSAVLSSNNRDAIKLVASAVWQTRMDPGWERSQESPAKRGCLE